MSSTPETPVRAVFLDRDGVINDAPVVGGQPRAPASLAKLKILPGVEQALHRLKAAGFRLIAVTNQPDVVRGTFPRTAVEEIHRYLLDHLCLDAIEVCFHDDDDACACRKPQPGMLIEGAKRFGVDLQHSFMVGDRWRDIEAGRRAGCTTILIGSGYGETFPSKPNVTFSSLAEAAEWILRTPADADQVA